MKKYKRLPHHSPGQLQLLQEIGNLKECPLAALPNGQDNHLPLTDVIKWFRLQHYRLEYRLIYYDLAVCCAYILFLCSALRFTAVIATGNWLMVTIVIVLCLGCMLFIGVHALPYLKSNEQAEAASWGQYRTTLKYGVKVYRSYLLTLLVLGILYGYNEKNFDGQLIVFIMPLSALLFAAGIIILTKNLKAKCLTEAYLREAGCLI